MRRFSARAALLCFLLVASLSGAQPVATVRDAPPNLGIASAAVTVGTSEAALPSSALSNRRRLIVQNRGTVAIYLGPTGVTTSSGLEVLPNGVVVIELGPGVTVFGISGSAGQNVRVFETS